MRTVRRYLHSLDKGDFEDVLDCFTDDVFYSHPPFLGSPPGSPRIELWGRDALRAYFANRGSRPIHHMIKASAVGGDRGFVSGVTFDPSGVPRASFVAEIAFARDARIRKYAAYVSAPAVRWDLEPPEVKG